MKFGSMENNEPVKADQEITIDSTWPRQYYMSSDPKERRMLLEAAMAKGVSPEADQIRMILWKIRYPEKGGERGMQMDGYLHAWMNFRFVAGSKDALFKGKLKRELSKAIDSMGFGEMEKYGELGQEILFDEIKHTAVLYMQLCTQDKQYGSVLWGMGSLKDGQLYGKIAKDVYEVGYQAAINANMVKECELWTRAVSTAFYESFPNHENLLAQEILKHKGE
ncbi:MAG: hypothetical protein PHS82_09555 [Lachnospiraceae bacterium]|nr:hypothetical protein [Lachnospiraceae bacterium]